MEPRLVSYTDIQNQIDFEIVLKFESDPQHHFQYKLNVCLFLKRKRLQGSFKKKGFYNTELMMPASIFCLLIPLTNSFKVLVCVKIF
jgi:hypothetical protein